jgi:bacillithiol system protein YtxJ
MLRDRLYNLETPEDVQRFLEENPTSIIFKAGTCHKTMQGFGFLQEQLETRDDLPVGLIRVVQARPASNFVAEQTGITHQSPQVILYKDGEAVFDVDNWDITPETLQAGLAKVPYTGAAAKGTGTSSSDLSVYLHLLEQYLSGMIDDRQFEFAYTTTFRDDASLRSREEVEILGSIFGDVDRHLEMHLMMGGRSNSDEVRRRAEAAYEQLRALAQQVQQVPGQ